MGQRIQAWVSNEFATLALGSKRLFMRFLIFMTMLSEQPDKSIWQAMGSRGQAKAAYRMLANEKLTTEAILSAHIDAISTRCGEIDKNEDSNVKEYSDVEEDSNVKEDSNVEETVVLAIQDTMSVNYSGHKKTKGLGYTGNNTLGVNVHTCLLLDANGVALGVPYQKVTTRPQPKQPGTNDQQQKRPIEEKESYRWIEAMRAVAEKTPKNIKLIHVTDREGDIYELFAQAQSTGQSFVIRATHNRITSENMRMIEVVENSPLVGLVEAKIPENNAKKQKERIANLEIRSASFNVKRPKKVSKQSAPASVALNIVIAQEKNPPEGTGPINTEQISTEQIINTEPIKWIIVTSLPVETIEQIVSIIEIYRKRWKIERFHFVLKSGCKIEDIQQRTLDGISMMILLYSIISIQIMTLTYLARTNPNAPAGLLFEDHEIMILWKAGNKTKTPPQKTVTIAEAAALVAKLGGFKGAPSDGPPGLKAIWSGLEKLYTLCSYAEFFGV